MRRLVLTGLLLVAALGATAEAEVRLFLYPVVERGDGAITVGDVARVDAGAASDKIRGVAIPADLCRDGYLDRTELQYLLSKHTGDLVCIEGSAVHLVSPRGAEPGGIPAVDRRVRAVKAGDRLTVVVKKNGIEIELPGVALADGIAGDAVNVRLKGASQVKGRITAEGRVEVVL